MLGLLGKPDLRGALARQQREADRQARAWIEREVRRAMWAPEEIVAALANNPAPFVPNLVRAKQT